MVIKSGKADELGKYEQVITISINKEHHGIELSFRFKPNATERAKLKKAGYKWHYQKMVWYATNTPDHAAAIRQLCGTVKYPDGWSQDRPELAEWTAKNAGRIMQQAITDHPDFMDLDAATQNNIYLETARTLHAAA